MQEAIPYKTWQTQRQPFMSRPSPAKPIPTNTVKPLKNDQPGNKGNGGGGGGDLKHIVSDNAVIVFSRQGCCMSHVVKLLLQGLGVNPAVYHVEEEHETKIVNELKTITAGDSDAAAVAAEELQFPAVFIGGKLFGGLDRIMATHITGELVPVLKGAGALWL